MPTSGDLRSGDFFSDQHLPPTPTEFANTTPYPSPPPSPSNFAGKTWIYLSGTSSGWILIQSDSRLYRSNKEETLFYLFATNNLHHARKWSQKPLYKQKKPDDSGILEHKELKSNFFFVGNWSKLPFIWWFLVTRTREREITSVSERLPDNPMKT